MRGQGHTNQRSILRAIETRSAPEAGEPAAGRARRAISTPALVALLGLLVSAGFAYFAVRRVRWTDTWSALTAARWEWLAPALALLALAFFVRALRWQSLYPRNRRPPLGLLSRALFFGYLFNNLLPMRAGEAVRVVTLNRLARVAVSTTAATILIERAYDVLSLVVLLFIVSPWLPHVTWLRAAGAIGAGVVVVLAVAVFAVARSRGKVLDTLFRPLRRLSFLPQESVERAPGDFLEGLAGLQRPRLAIVSFAWTTVSWLVLGVAYWLVTIAFRLHVSPLAGLLVVIGIGLAMILPSSPAALGVFEGATVVVLGAYGVSDSRALSYALVLHALSFLPFLILAPFLMRGGVTRRRGTGWLAGDSRSGAT